MKRRLMALMALALAVSSCQSDSFLGFGAQDEVDVKLAFSAPDMIGDTRTDGDSQMALNSAFGAIDYLDGAPVGDYRADWDDVDLRYSLEIYDVENLTQPIKDRLVIVKDRYEPVQFDLRLIAGRTYRFAVFADFVPHGTAAAEVGSDVETHRDLGLRHTIGANLTDIAIKESTEALNDEIADAYFASFEYTPAEDVPSNVVEQTLTRPYAKVRVVATDLAELNLNVHPKYVNVTYMTYDEDTAYPTKFNAVKGKLVKDAAVAVAEGESEGKTLGAEYVAQVRDNRDQHVYNSGYDANVDVNNRASHLTLFTDYILATSGEHTPISFTMTVLDENKVKIKEVEFDTQIPLERNYLTTIVGNVLTTKTDIQITINDDFLNANKTEDEPFHEVVE